MPAAGIVVYKITSPSGKAYIGLTSNLHRRCLEHKRKTSKTGTCFANAIQKYGWENFMIETLVEGLSIKTAQETEKRLIEELKTLSPNGYNMDVGGVGFSYTDEMRANLCKSMGRRIQQTRGAKGYYLHKCGKFVVRYTFMGKRQAYGSFATENEAMIKSKSIREMLLGRLQCQQQSQ